MSDTSTKKLENNDGKGISVAPDGVKIYAQEGLKLQLSKSGILIKSNTDITIEGKDDLRIIGKNVRITAKEKLTIKGGSNSINMKENGTIEFAGTKLNMLVSETSEESGFDEKPRQLTPTVIYEEDKITGRAIKDDKDVEIEEIPLGNDIALSNLLKKVPSATLQAVMRGTKAVGKVKEKNEMEDFFEETSESSDGDDKVSDKKYDRPTPGEETMSREAWVKYYRSMVVGKSKVDFNGVRIINKKYAGKVFYLSGDLAEKYPNGVKFNNDGFPDFSPYSEKNVTVKNLEGDAYNDFKKANEEAGYSSTPSGYTWHHVENGETMQLVPTDLHGAVRHTGGASGIRNANK